MKRLDYLKTALSGTTSTLRINPDMSSSNWADQETKEAIEKHGHASDDPKDIPIYVARSDYSISEEGRTQYLRFAMFWSLNKNTALKRSKEEAKKQIKVMLK